MLEPTYQADVVVVGSGIAGLSAARRLTGAGVTTV
ncbi:FAD-binding protein, partial [Streptomyces prasinus]